MPTPPSNKPISSSRSPTEPLTERWIDSPVSSSILSCKTHHPRDNWTRSAQNTPRTFKMMLGESISSPNTWQNLVILTTNFQQATKNLWAIPISEKCCLTFTTASTQQISWNWSFMDSQILTFWPNLLNRNLPKSKTKIMPNINLKNIPMMKKRFRKLLN